MLDNFSMLLLPSADFFFSKTTFFQKIISETLPKCQAVWIKIRTNVLLVLAFSARTCVLLWDFFKKANDYDNFNCYALGIAKLVVGTSENLAEVDYDIIKMVAILNFNTNLLCLIISIIVGRFQIIRYRNVQNNKCCLLTPK